MPVFQETCPECDGVGKRKLGAGRWQYTTEECPRCKGAGTILVDETDPKDKWRIS